MNNNKVKLIKIVLDIIMSALLVLMFNKNVISLDFHEIGGLFLCVFILIHNLLNRKWIAAVTKKIFSKDLNFKTRLCYIIDSLLLISIVAILVSGISISKVVFSGLSLHFGNLKVLHYFAAALTLILVGIHIGLHWSFVTGMFKKLIKIPTIIAKPLSIILVIAVVLGGGYSIYSSSFRMWLSGPFTSTQMKGGQPSRDSDFQKNEEPSQNSNSAVNNNINNENKGKGFGKGEIPSGEGFPKNGKGRPQGGGHGFEGEGQGRHGGSSNVLTVILTFTSIIGLFAAIIYYCEKLLRRKKKPLQAIQ